MEPVYVPKNPHEKALQRALMQYRNPKNRALVEEALRLARREDLIGWGPGCLIRPEKGKPGQPGKENRPDRKMGTRKKKTIRNIHRKTSAER